MTLGKTQVKFKVKIEGEKHIYIIPAKQSYHHQSSIVITLYDRLSKVVLVKDTMLEKICCDLGKRSI